MQIRAEQWESGCPLVFDAAGYWSFAWMFVLIWSVTGCVTRHKKKEATVSERCTMEGCIEGRLGGDSILMY